MNFKITKETVGKIGKAGGILALYGIAAVVSRISVDDVLDSIRYGKNVSYGDAIGVIMNDSCMLDSYKNEAIAVLKKNADSEYYKAVVKIMKSNMLGSGKVTAITNLNAEES